LHGAAHEVPLPEHHDSVSTKRFKRVDRLVKVPIVTADPPCDEREKAMHLVESVRVTYDAPIWLVALVGVVVVAAGLRIYISRQAVDDRIRAQQRSLFGPVGKATSKRYTPKTFAFVGLTISAMGLFVLVVGILGMTGVL
jgi:hypothetical protein